MRLWLQDILGTSAPVLTQEQDNQNKGDLERKPRFSGLEQLAADQAKSLFLRYTQAITWHVRLGAAYGLPLGAGVGGVIQQQSYISWSYHGGLS